ncbi:MAG TPA: NAD(P)H-binding protein [Candidatus Limnocylindrales bacterium]|nr:NAD(P)H-binding protein [Candidatus Limnocylindrales bacterium]
MRETDTGRVVVTGAFGFTGRHITRRLVAMGKRVRTLTGHPHRANEFGDRVEVAPLDFSDPAGLVESLRGAECLFNTYWVRFNYGRTTFDEAVANGRMLFAAARDAGVRKVVHVSITNPSLDSPLPYYRGKAQLESALRQSGLRYAILRPNVIFGDEGILINNIAWLVRHFPVFAIPGDGKYGLQPIFVEDMADLAIQAAGEAEDSIRDAVGPEVFAFDGLVQLIARSVGRRVRLVHVAPRVALALSGLVGLFVRDRILTREEVEGLMAGLLVSSGPATAPTRLSDWLRANATEVGARYASEIGRHYAREGSGA